jgi:hypothetical protein
VDRNQPADLTPGQGRSFDTHEAIGARTSVADRCRVEPSQSCSRSYYA